MFSFMNDIQIRASPCFDSESQQLKVDLQIEGILPKGPFPPCLRMADRPLLAGYPQNMIQ